MATADGCHAIGKRHKRKTRLQRQRARQRVFGDELQGEQRLAKQCPSDALLGQRLFELRGRNRSGGDERVAQH